MQLDFMRWLTVSVPGEPGRRSSSPRWRRRSSIPRTPSAPATCSARAYIGNFILSTPDCRATYERCSRPGVEFIQEPVEQPYGIDCAARDPFGNEIRIAEQEPRLARVTPAGWLLRRD